MHQFDSFQINLYIVIQFIFVDSLEELLSQFRRSAQSFVFIAPFHCNALPKRLKRSSNSNIQYNFYRTSNAI